MTELPHTYELIARAYCKDRGLEFRGLRAGQSGLIIEAFVPQVLEHIVCTISESASEVEQS